MKRNSLAAATDLQVLTVLIVLTVLTTTSLLTAATVTWDGDDTTNNWSVGSNWTGDPDNTAPGSGDDVWFGDTDSVTNETTVTNIVNADTTVSSLTYETPGKYHNTEVTSGATLTVTNSFKVGTSASTTLMNASLTGSVTAGALHVGSDMAWGGQGARLYLGNATIHTDNMYVGYGSSTDKGFVEMIGDGTGATVTIRGNSGGTSRANLNIGRATNNYSQGTVNFENATVDAMLGTVYLGYNPANSGHNPTTGTLSMTNGTIDATYVLAGRDSYDDWPTTGTININGGLFRAGTIDLVAQFDGTAIPENEGIINLSGGTLEATTVQAGSGLAAKREINFTSGTIRNYDSGSSTTDLTIGGLTSFNLIGAENTHTFDATDGHSITVNSEISGEGGITKIGAGTLDLAVNNTYTGNTTVTAGTLKLSDGTSTNSISDSPIITVAASATLDVTGLSDGTLALTGSQTLTGAGAITGSVSSVSGTTFTPGDSPGELDISGNLTLADGIVYNWEATSTTLHDVIGVDGVLTLPGSGSTITLNLSLVDPSQPLLTPFDLELFTYGSLVGDPSVITWEINTDGSDKWLNVPTNVVAYGSALYLENVLFIPEPTSIALLGLGALALLRRRRRQAA